MNFKELADRTESYIIDRRRYYHAHPELSNEEKETTNAIVKDLEEIGLEIAFPDMRLFDHDPCKCFYHEVFRVAPVVVIAVQKDGQAVAVADHQLVIGGLIAGQICIIQFAVISHMRRPPF